MTNLSDDPYAAEPRLATWDVPARRELTDESRRDEYADDQYLDDSWGDPAVGDDDDGTLEDGTRALRGDPPPTGSRAQRQPGRRGAPLPVAAAVAALWAAVLGFGPVLVLAVIGALGTGATAAGVARLAAGAWLLGHGVPVQTPADRITLVPLGITAWLVWRMIRAGVHAGRALGAHRARSGGPALRAGVAVAVAYGLVGALVAGVSATTGLAVSPARAGLSFALVAGAAATLGALANGRAGRRWASRLPRLLTGGLRAGLAAVAFLIAAGAAAGGLALALAGGAATDMLGSFHAGVAGQAGITVVCLVFLPNLAVWGAAYLLGPGFAVGAGTVVSPGDVLLGPVPALPVLAGLPSGPLSGVGPALLGVPLLAGLAAGWLLARRSAPGEPERSWPALLGAATLAGPVAGLVLRFAMAAASGALGSGRLSELGPVDWRVSVFATGVIAVGTVFGAATAKTLTRPR